MSQNVPQLLIPGLMGTRPPFGLIGVLPPGAVGRSRWCGARIAVLGLYVKRSSLACPGHGRRKCEERSWRRDRGLRQQPIWGHQPDFTDVNT